MWFKVLTLFSLYIMKCLFYIRAHFEMVQCRGHIQHHEIRSRSKINLPQDRSVKTDKSPMIMASKLFK